MLAHDRVDLLRHPPLVVGKLGDRLREGVVEVLLLLRRLPLGGGRPHRGALLGAEPALLALLRLSHTTMLSVAFHAERRARLGAPDRQERVMPNVLLDAAGRRRSPATMPGFHSSRPPRNKGRRYPADPPTVEEIIAVMRQAGTTPHGLRMRGLIVVLWRAGLRIHEALALTEADLDTRRGAVLVRRGKGGRRREVGIDDWAWEQLQQWLPSASAARRPAVLHPHRTTRGRAWSPAAAREQLRQARRSPASGDDSRRTNSARPRRRDGARGRPGDRHQRQLGAPTSASPRSTSRASTAPRSSTPSTPAGRQWCQSTAPCGSDRS